MSENNNFIKVDEWIPDDKDIFIRPDGKSVVIEFDRIFKNADSTLNTFIIKKDSYVKYEEMLCDYINYFLKFYDKEKELIVMYANIRYVIGKYDLKRDAFIDLLYKILFTDSMKEKITRMVEDNYCIDVTSDNPDAKYTESLEFTNEHVKLLLKISMGMKLMVPVMFHYINKMNIQKSQNYLFPYYQRLFYIFDDKIDIFTKLYITVFSRVNASSTQNKKMFSHREIFGVTALTFTNDLLKDNIISETIWRYSFEKNPVNFNSVVLNKQLRFFSRVKYKRNLIEVDNEVQQDGLSGLDKLEMNSVHLDESKIILADVNIPDVIRRIKRTLRIDISDDEINYYMEKHVPHPFQVNLVNHYYAKDFGGFNDLNLLTKRQYMTLLVLLKRRLQIEGATYLPQLISGNYIGARLNVRTIQNHKFLDKIENSVLYQDLMNNEFIYLKEFDSKGSPILQMLSILINNQFTWVDYDDQEHFGEVIEINQDIVSDEFLNFLIQI